MVQVYLPFGYPLVSGAEAQTLIYQGNVVRLYTLPKDPRTDSQMFERRFLSDMSKVRTTAGTFVKGALRAALGNRWGTALFQLIKADDGGRWSEAVVVWDSGDNTERQTWRDVAPYALTFNDPGKTFFCIARVMAQILFDFTGVLWWGQVWELSQANDAVEWWGYTKDQLPAKQIIYAINSPIEVHGSWTYENDVIPFYSVQSGGSPWLRFYFSGRSFVFTWFGSVNYASADLFLDGVLAYTVNQYRPNGTGGYTTDAQFGYRGVHIVELRPTATNGPAALINASSFDLD
jgi:hypothetical protein